jgi:hypothetical protein
MLSLCVAVLLLSGCVAFEAPVQVPGGLIYQHTKAPLQTDVDVVDLGTKHGTAKTQYVDNPILRLFGGPPLAVAWNDASIAEAARNGGIETVKHVDYEIFRVLGVYIEFTVHAYGD